MNHLKMLTAGCAIALSVTSLDSLASATRTEGLNACAEAVVTELGNSKGSPIDFRLSSDSDTSGKKLNRRETFHLDIRNPEDDAIVARIDCVVDRRARVQKVIDVPLDGPDAEQRATMISY